MKGSFFVCVTGATAIQRGRARLYPAVEEYVQELGTRYSEVSWHNGKENLSPLGIEFRCRKLEDKLLTVVLNEAAWIVYCVLLRRWWIRTTTRAAFR